MAKKVFYNRRYKMPAWGQLYAVWGIIAFITCGILFFTSLEKIPGDPAPQLSTALNGFAEGLYYELREAEPGSQFETVQSYAARLEKKHGYKSREEKSGRCRVIRITRGTGPAYGIATTVKGEKAHGAFFLLTFLDRIPAQNPPAAVSARFVFAEKGCDTEAELAGFQSEGLLLPIVLDGAEAHLQYDRVPELKNLKLRRHFESLFFMRDRTLWANTVALLAAESATGFLLPVPAPWAASPEAGLAQNPLLRHPLLLKAPADDLVKPVALYAAADYQILRGGFFALLVLFWLLAAIPLANALGTFKEKFDLGSALTSTILYSIAFFGYFILLKTVLRFAKADFAVVLLSLFLLPAVFIPVRILQKNVLRAELNRAGLHILVQLSLTVVLFFNPLIALCGFLCLMLSSAFSRAPAGRKLLRMLLLLVFFAGFFWVTRQPLGSFANFFAALLPAFSVAGILKIILLALTGGNLVALFFVPRERV